MTTHSPTCDCVTCNKDGRAAMVALSRGDYTQYEEHLHRYHAARGTRMRSASHGKYQLRTNIHFEEKPMTYTPPDPYAAGIAALRANGAYADAEQRELAVRELRTAVEQATYRAASSPMSARELSAYAPPDPYAEGLKVLRSRTR